MQMTICDVCEKKALPKTNMVSPTGWSKVKITGTVQDPDNIGSHYARSSIHVSKDICNDCVKGLVKFGDQVKPSMQEQFEAVAIEYLSDLCVDAVQEAMESQ